MIRAIYIYVFAVVVVSSSDTISLVSFGVVLHEVDRSSAFEGLPPHQVLHATSIGNVDSAPTKLLWNVTLPQRNFCLRLSKEGPPLLFNPGQENIVVRAFKYLSAQGVTQGEGCRTLPCLVALFVKHMINYVRGCSQSTPREDGHFEHNCECLKSGELCVPPPHNMGLVIMRTMLPYQQMTMHF
jgi:hypothetical protein